MRAPVLGRLSAAVGVLVAAVSACVAPHPVALEARPAPATLSLPREIRVRTNGKILTVPLEDYVLGTALSEVSPVGEAPATTTRIFEVQAVIARTYAIGHLGRHANEAYDLCDGTHCQLYQPGRVTTSRFSEVARRAVASTRGTVLTFRSHPAETLFHSDCGGHTASASAVWGGAAVPYLLGEADDVPRQTHRSWQTRLDAAQLRNVLSPQTRAELGRRLRGVRVATRDEGGRAMTVNLQGDHVVTVRAEAFRGVITEAFGTKVLQSTRFEVTREGAAFVFSGRGYGHGVGLCQVGAAARARRGDALEDILAAYFPGASAARGDSR